MNPIQQTFILPVSADKAFELFVNQFDSWWPKEYTWSADGLETIAIEPKVGGRCYEQGPHGFECDWGRVLVHDPPKRLLFTWQISPNRVPQPNPENASEVEVTFKEEENGQTDITFIHRHFEKHGEGAEGYREAMGSSMGWPYILERYREAVG
jgi:uncharacterized protein YndB with AHSA1/START domain